MRTNRHRPLLILLVFLLGVSVALAAKECPACGAENRDDAKFCKTCGAKLRETPQRRVPQRPRVRAEVGVSGGVVTITSEPAGAEVSVDGEPRGATPLELGGLRAGRHTLVVSHSGYRDYEAAFNIAAQLGTVVVSTEPEGAQVWVDDSLRGTTSSTGLAVAGLSFGKHRVVARLYGYQSADKEVELASAGPIALNIRLGTGRGYLEVQSRPPGAMITANFTEVGRTNAVLELQPERYVLSLNRPGYREWVGYAQVAVGETLLISQALERIKPRRLPFLIAGAAGLLFGGTSAVMAELEYAKYRGAEGAADAEKHRRSTHNWDVSRNVALGTGVALGVCYVFLRW